MPDAIVFALSGDIDREDAVRLRQFLTSATDRRVTLDLQNVTLVDRAAVQFLANVETTGIRLVNCPEYVRTWIAAETQPAATDSGAGQPGVPTVIRRRDGTRSHFPAEAIASAQWHGCPSKQ
jgi:ABC-type transporter Mla MlaB component